VFPPPGKKFIGIMTTDGAYNFTDLDNFTKAVKHQPEVYEFSQAWVRPNSAGLEAGYYV
jgi:hypothetical protein